jgi:hypothetical protein
MGRSFPGIIVHAADQLSVPQSGNWCGQVGGFAHSERPDRAYLTHARVSQAIYEAKSQRA